MLSEHQQHLIERLSRATAVRTRRMFGGVGVYSGDLFFALIANDVLYFKVDDRSRPDFVARGMAPFQPFSGRPSMLSYFEVPADVLADASVLRAWVAKSLAAAREKTAKAAKRGRRTKASGIGHAAKTAQHAIEAEDRSARRELLNLGPASMRWLAEVGVRTRADLEQRGSVATFLAVKARGRTRSANLLYALEGALLDLRWDRLPAVVKANLRQRAGLR